ncbi:SMP-30/gluconolactonase/LRE family protein [Pseudoalteromonas sp. SS15]|uniref:SMP-30/gluconolactonase/LRE family protein n=1 Tax=Pseudoalteromonas sp. SS15 TaxID=3139393 RepID=UPI003BA9A4F3
MDSVFYSKKLCELGEGIFYDSIGGNILWLDIINSTLFIKRIDKSDNVMRFNLDLNPSTIFKVELPHVYFSDAKGIAVFNTDSQQTKRLYALGENISDGLDMRTNDGAMLDGKYLFGTMFKDPSKGKGKLFLYDPNNSKLLSSVANISIPNTFIELDDELLISDSQEQKVYAYNKRSLFSERRVWADFSDTNMTPDGGCLSIDGKVFIAMWGGACVKCFDLKGNELHEINVPALQPTNCVISDSELYVTTARDGLSDDELVTYPLSGALFRFQLGEVCG